MKEVNITIIKENAFLNIDEQVIRNIVNTIIRHYCVSSFIILEIYLLHSIRHINMQYRKIDKDTDIVSLQFDKNNINNKHPIILGSIFLSENIINEKIKQYSDNYIWYILIHGLLHLCNFTHDTDQTFAIMRNEENKWLKEFKIDDSGIQKIYL